ncbi:hypothetical protein SAMN04487770_15021 [Butyrivibrio sp. ob235]|uniref:hypothetical protein n=1 Tax=Butyrivibrio sp. ob235 TaxID=1761780 RepID=UPI0008D3CAE8|nr:hypothetical protein [Butyrivibrio sp. ob235]SEM59376.1 hypothetical protein SAMN04487770_15021 [Butyrivibrio sp. ob235]
MALIKCPECGKEISDQAECCPSCGCPINEEPRIITNNDFENSIDAAKRKSGKTLIILGIICWIGSFVTAISIADDLLMDKVSYIYSGYHSKPGLVLLNKMLSIVNWVGLILIIVGIVIVIVHRKKRK